MTFHLSSGRNDLNEMITFDWSVHVDKFKEWLISNHLSNKNVEDLLNENIEIIEKQNSCHSHVNRRK